ncbi:hypothetical protein [Enemella dayhoffiae]|uniref:hypothetical protein n=1 Tax=Enemella dayhoffiae TaxID=2016507 RepID=UPI0011406DB8|nr:hypothetical protein [Enemella dayhoffiae]
MPVPQVQHIRDPALRRSGRTPQRDGEFEVEELGDLRRPVKPGHDELLPVQHVRKQAVLVPVQRRVRVTQGGDRDEPFRHQRADLITVFGDGGEQLGAGGGGVIGVRLSREYWHTCSNPHPTNSGACGKKSGLRQTQPPGDGRDALSAAPTGPDRRLHPRSNVGA